MYILKFANLSATCGWSVDFSEYSGLLHQLTDIHDTTELLSKVVITTTTPWCTINPLPLKRYTFVDIFLDNKIIKI
jgi:hypothetical protein